MEVKHNLAFILLKIQSSILALLSGRIYSNQKILCYLRETAEPCLCIGRVNLGLHGSAKHSATLGPSLCVCVFCV